MRLCGKRGAKEPGAGPAVSLIGIILLIFIFYVILIPPEERARILDGTQAPDADGGSSGVSGNVLLREQVGRLGFVSEEEVEHAVPNMQLLETREAQVLVEVNSFEVSKSAFGGTTKEVRFALSPESVEDVFLSFQAPVRRGVLKVTLNGFDLFEARVESQTPPVVQVPHAMLARENVLVFEVTGGFFEEKRYSLSDVKVIGDVTDVNSQQASNSFVLSRGEFEHVERARLSFFVECLQADVGNLEVVLNGKAVYSAVPVCDALNQIDLFRQDFTVERNALVFRLSSGGVFIESIRLLTQLSPTKSFTGFFSVSEDMFFNIGRGARGIFLRVKFVDDGEGKIADVNVNGVLSSIDQEDDVFELDISNRIQQGNNYVELTPRSELNIVELVVEYR